MAWFYKKILIISDNVQQCAQLYKIVEDIDNQVSFSWCCSPYSKIESFNKIGVVFKSIDLKVENDIENIIDNYSLVISMHCKQLFPASLITRVKCINVHPGYNPINRGWYPQVFAIINNTVIGATIHEIDEQLDHGNIIDRIKVEKFSWDTSLELYNRILEAEVLLIKKNLVSILCNVYETYKPENEGLLYLKKDFKNLCHIDLDHTDTFRGFINRLRALSHSSFKNAYFIDEETGRKIFINIQLELQED